MRPGMFDNTKSDLELAFARHAAGPRRGRPARRWRSRPSTFFDDVVFQRALTGQALPYPGGQAMLVEFPVDVFPTRIADRFFDLRCRGIRPGARRIPNDTGRSGTNVRVLDPLVDGGAVLLLDVAAVVGKYGRATERAALKLLEEGYYYAPAATRTGPRTWKMSRSVSRDSKSSSRRGDRVPAAGRFRFRFLKGTVDA